MSSEPLKCARCRQPLPEGSGYCVSCGCSNDFAVQQRRLNVNEQADKRIGWMKSIREALRGIGFFRRF